jgi:adenosylcobyric acid synthase
VLLEQHSWGKDIARHLRYGGKVIGICGGYQMLGRTIHGSIGIQGTSVIEGTIEIEGTTEIEGTIDSSQGLG